MEKCIGCFKPTRNPAACIECKYYEARKTCEDAVLMTGLSLTPEEEEEITYELYCALQGIEGGKVTKMTQSLLANIIAKCSDTAVYLPKKRFANLDDMKVILFDLGKSAAYITNGDTVIRVSDLPPDALDGLRSDLPAYDYIDERFIPNPLPYDVESMDKAFDDGSFLFAVTLPVTFLLKNMFAVFPDALSRRNCLSVFDVGYGMYEGSIVIPKFDLSENQVPYFKPAHGDKIIALSKSSTIPDEFIEPDTSYVGHVVSVEPDIIRVDVYKQFEETVTMGMYRIMDTTFTDDIHPFRLAHYAEPDLLKFKLVSTIDKFDTLADKMRVYRNFNPIAMELEYLYETLLLYESFGYRFVNLYIKSPDDPFLLEGVIETPEQPIVEAAIAPVAVGVNGSVCEARLAEALR